MIGLLQRVTEASVTISDALTAQIGSGILVLVGIEKGDSAEKGKALTEKLLSYRIFSDEQDKMNLGLEEVGGELLLVPQFTLVADTSKGLRPGFDRGEKPDVAARIYQQLVQEAQVRYPRVQSGVFGADMQVQLINNGPVTFWLKV